MNKQFSEKNSLMFGLLSPSHRSRLLQLILLVMLLLVMSALGVIYSSYKSRQLFSQLQRHGGETVRLEEQWGRLLLEQSTWASHGRIESLAKTELKMVAPSPEATIVVEQ